MKPMLTPQLTQRYVHSVTPLKLHGAALSFLRHKSKMMSLFVIVIALAACLNVIVSECSTMLLKVIPSTTGIATALTLLYVVVIAFLIRQTKLPLEQFGLTLKGFWHSVWLAFWISCAMLVLFLAFRAYMMGLSFNSFDSLLVQIKQRANLNSIYKINMTTFSTGAYFLYFFFLAPAQEFIVRCGMQSLFYIYLDSDYKRFYSIALSNFVFASAHFFYGSLGFVVLTFCVGVFFSLLFVFYRSFFAVALTHSIAGTGFFLIFFY